MRNRYRRWTGALLVATSTITVGQVAGSAAADTSPAVTVARGTLGSGGQYLIEVPERWSGTLLVWSPGYVSAAGLAASDAPDATTRAWLLGNGYALAGSQPRGSGWAVAEIMPDAVATTDEFVARFGRPRSTIAWGISMGGQVTAGLVQNHPDTFDGALPLCGSVAGPVAMLNAGLDAAWSLKQLTAPAANLDLVHITDETARRRAAQAMLDAAQATPAGRARIALAAAFAQLSTWSSAGTPEPAADDYAEQQRQQYGAFLSAVFSPRQPLEQRAGGNFSWNTGVDYGDLLARSGATKRVTALYEQAGLRLDDDLAVLASAPRIAADAPAVDYMARNVSPTGHIEDPVLTLNEAGDNSPTLVQTRAYADAVRRHGKEALLRQAFVHRPGHCGYRPAEVVTALLTLEHRISSGRWEGTDAAALNQRAAQLAASDPSLGVAAFGDEDPPPMLRPYSPDSAGPGVGAPDSAGPGVGAPDSAGPDSDAP